MLTSAQPVRENVQHGVQRFCYNLAFAARNPSAELSASVSDELNSASDREARRPLARRSTNETSRATPWREAGSFSKKLALYRQLLVSDDYGLANAAVLASVTGLGIANGGYMVLMDVLAQRGGSLPVVGFMAFSAVSTICTAAGSTYLSHFRDNQDLLPCSEAPSTHRVMARFCNRLVLWGGATAVQNACLTFATWGYLQNKLSAPTLLATSVVTKSSEACFTAIEQGYWNCIKTHLGNQEDQAVQQDQNRTIIGLEGTSVAFLYNVATIGVYVLARDRYDGRDQAVNRVLIALALGGVIALSPKVYFWQRGKKFRLQEAVISPETHRQGFPLCCL